MKAVRTMLWSLGRRRECASSEEEELTGLVGQRRLMPSGAERVGEERREGNVPPGTGEDADVIDERASDTTEDWTAYGLTRRREGQPQCELTRVEA